jgi:hypothetical protein
MKQVVVEASQSALCLTTAKYLAANLEISTPDKFLLREQSKTKMM